MKNTYLILANLLVLLTLSACTTTPPKKEYIEVEEPQSKEVTITTYECFADPNLESPTTLKEKMQDGTNLSGMILICSGETVVVDTILDYGPDEVNILDITTGQWKTHAVKDCHLAREQ